MSYHKSKYEESPAPILQIDRDERNESIEMMRSIFNIQSTSRDMVEMQKFILKFIEDLGDDNIELRFDSMGNLYVTKGEAMTYPCIVSHMDTVHDIIHPEDYVVLNSDTEFFAINTQTKSRTGVGGDDNNGIYCCLHNLMLHDKIKLAFFIDEEIGCVGSASCDMSFFEDVSFVLQADRQGYADVTMSIMDTEMMSIPFFDAISSDLDAYSRDLCDGGMTDVYQLANNGLEVAMANFSCGYYQPHSHYEYVNIDELILTSILFRDIINSAYIDGEKYHIKRDLYSYGADWGNEYSYSEYGKEASLIDSYSSFPDFKSETEKVGRKEQDNSCTFCGGALVFDNSVDSFYCHSCFDYDYSY